MRRWVLFFIFPSIESNCLFFIAPYYIFSNFIWISAFLPEDTALQCSSNGIIPSLRQSCNATYTFIYQNYEKYFQLITILNSMLCRHIDCEIPYKLHEHANTFPWEIFLWNITCLSYRTEKMNDCRNISEYSLLIFYLSFINYILIGL